MGNVRRYILVHLLLGMSTLLPGARIDWKPPAQVALPQTMRPATGNGSGWKRQNDLFDDFWQAAKNDFVMDEWRDRMIRKLMAIGSE